MKTASTPEPDSPRVYFGIGHDSYLGARYDPAPHSHDATQFVVGLDAKVEVEVAAEHGADGAPLLADAVAIASDTVHRATSEGAVALLVIEPTTIAADVWQGSPTRSFQLYQFPGEQAHRL